jgi:hypothetical protein
MVNILKKKTELTAGFKINNRGDCELLSELILDKTSDTLSYNALRRFFGLASYMKPNKSTLNTLAKYNGYKGYPDFLLQNPYEYYWTIKEKLYDIINSDSKEVLDFIDDLNIKNKDSIDILISLCRELIHFKRFDVLNEVFKANIFNFNAFTYEEVLHFGNSVGILFRNVKNINEYLLLNINFLNFVYSIFVDYSYLSGYYGIWCEFVSKNSSDIQMRCFAFSILQLKNYIELKPVSFNDLSNIDYTDFHPILRGRIVSIKILCEQNFDDLNIENQIIDDSKKEITWDFLFEPIFLAILTKDFLFMRKIIHMIKKHKNPIQYHHLKHKKLYELMVFFYENWNQKNIISDEKMNKINSFRFEYSYQEIISIFKTILMYHTQKNKSYHLNKYIEMTEKIRYPIFSKEYLLTYFD